MKLREALDLGTKELSRFSNNPEFESFVFLEESTGKKREEILTNEEELDEKAFLKFENYLRRRKEGEPWQYIIGSTNFLGFKIFIEEGVFIPRPETEFLTFLAIHKLKNLKAPFILEIGTGSGAISLSIAGSLKEANIIATDISRKAIKICKKNFDFHNLRSYVSIVIADLLSCFSKEEKFDLIISNPPYIPIENLSSLDEVVKKEPMLALNGGENGVYFINKILEEGSLRLRKGGYILIEIDEVNLPYIKIPERIYASILPDQFGRNRILFGIRK
ncbi:MAG: peptide chain release factor N(5)-glutamine methyltransferase [candidate division WOR-3 bacterium]